MKSSKTSFLRNCISGWNVRTANSQDPDSEDSDIYCTFALRSLSPKCEQLTDCYLIETSPCGIHVVLDERKALR